MHSPTLQQAPVLSLAVDTIGQIDLFDAESIGCMWTVFTKCKSHLQNGPRLENLSWRLWYRETNMFNTADLPPEPSSSRAPLPISREQGKALAADAGWSDPEWTEASVSSDESEADDDNDVVAPTQRLAAAATRRRSSLRIPPDDPRQAKDADRAPAGLRPAMRRLSSASITGNSLQKMIDGLLPDFITPPRKARSAVDVPPANLDSRLGEGQHSPGEGRHSPEARRDGVRGRSAPDVCAISADDAALADDRRRPHKVDAATQFTPSQSHRPSPAQTPPRLNRRDTITPQILTHLPTVPSNSKIFVPASVAAPSHNTSSKSLHTTRFEEPVKASSSRTNLAVPSAKLQPPQPTSSRAPLLRRQSHKDSQKGAEAPKSHQGADAPKKSDSSSSLAGHQRRAGSSASLRKLERPAAGSTTSFEPWSVTKGFDTTLYDERPNKGSIAAPPTPQVRSTELADVSPKASPMKPSAQKKIFFISSLGSNSDEDDESDGGRGDYHPARAGAARARHAHKAYANAMARKASRSKSPAAKQRHAPGVVVESPAENAVDAEWGDEDDDDDEEDASSGWGSECSTESDADAPKEKSPAMFTKRLAMAPGGLKPRAPGLLSQLFHPDLSSAYSSRVQSEADVAAKGRAGPAKTANSKPAAVLRVQSNANLLSSNNRSKSWLRGRPDDVEMETSSEDEPDGPKTDDGGGVVREVRANAVAIALARHQRQTDDAAAIAPPQTPRTTRRAMLATELSESLRRNLLWERQTRNKPMGAGALWVPPPAAPATVATAAGPPRTPKSEVKRKAGLIAPHPSPATRNSSPIVTHMVRRHTTGTGLYLAAQKDKFAIDSASASESGDSVSGADDGGGAAVDRKNVYGGGYLQHGLHSHGW